MAIEIGREREAVEPYVEKILTWIAKKYPVFLVVDNVDQFEREEFQRSIFIEAQAAAKRMSLNVIITLRDATYLRHRNTPSFDAFQVDTIYIDPPSTLPVLSRRFTYAKKFLDGRSADIRTENGSRFRIDNLGLFIDTVAASLLSERNGVLLEVLSGGDIRRALALIREFLASGHTSSDRVLWDFAEERSGARDVRDKRFAFPRHEIFKACVLGQRRFYREEDSLLPDIFDAKLATQGKQLLRLHLVSKLVANAAVANYEGALLENLRADLFQIGVSDADFGSVIGELLNFKVIRTADGRSLAEKSQLLPTRLGGYLVRELIGTFSYIELCSIDANIFIDEHWHTLKDLTLRIDAASGYKQLMLRCERAESFVKYLRDLDESWAVQCKRYNLERVLDFWL
ncbi:MAG: hypothetical protein JWO69_2065 [Thermoleophilia bacterium]|nr:hypothetical protein [Thermoleophilia bacterium]